MTSFVVDAEAALAAYLERTRVVHVVRFGLDGRVQIVNTIMAAQLGVADSLRGRSVFDYLTEPDAALLRHRLSEPSPASDPVHLNFCAAGGVPFTLSCCLTVYPDGGLVIGEPIYDDERRLQRQLIELNEELTGLVRQRQRSVVSAQQGRHAAEADNRAKDDGLAVIAHELRQPLSTAMAAVAVLRQNPARPERALQSLERQIASMTRLVEDLLHASQVMRGAITLERDQADLCQLVQEAVESIDPSVRERGQQIRINRVDAPLPVSVDLRRMRQVLANILSNAVKYTPVGGSIVIAVEQASGNTCRVRVRDSGAGISAEAHDRVFELFVRETSGGNGLGIGLAIAKRLVELHGGTVEVQSEGVGRGAEFIVSLPLLGADSV